MLQMRFGEADVAAPTQAAAADSLGMRALDPGTRGVARPERLGVLVLAMNALRRSSCSASKCSRACSPTMRGSRLPRVQRTREAVPGRKARFEHHAAFRVGAGQP